MMDLTVDSKHISLEERDEIRQQVKAELVEHLYQGCLPGTISGIPVGLVIFIAFYSYTPTHLLLTWFIFYNTTLAILTSLYIAYRRYKNRFNIMHWQYAYMACMSLCALSWGWYVFLIPDDLTRQYFAFIALFLITTGYATGSIGVFELCLITLALIIIPLLIWCLYKGEIFYYLVGAFALIYIGFMCSITYRSTRWFKESLKLKLENTLVSYQANHDLLTHLPNQRLLPQYLLTAIQSAESSQLAFAVISFSLNRMEMIHDSFGYAAGDTIIRSLAVRLNGLAERLTSSEAGKRCIITISRKDTFNIVLFPLTMEDADENIKLFFSVLDEPFYLEQRGIRMTASLGVSFFPNDGKDEQTLITNAGAATLHAKQFGGNHVAYYRKEINAEMPRQIELETDLHQAISGRQFKVYYQPLIDLTTTQIIGMEALLRWIHPIHGMISPVQFIPLAEETGMIVPIGSWVLEEACRQTHLWHEMGFPHLRIAVNLAGKQLREENNIIELIGRVLKETTLPPHALELEITETAILDESIMSTLANFKKMGLSLAVDDFGTGYSGLSYLKRFSIDKLKIDQSFIRDIPASNDSIAIVSAILAIAKELHIHTLAEGVETEEQLAFLRSKECDYAQGYYFGKPMDAAAFTQLLTQTQLVH